MTLSLYSMQGMIDAVNKGSDADAGELMAGAADAATVAQGLEDPSHAIKGALSDRAHEVCPDLSPMAFQ